MGEVVTVEFESLSRREVPEEARVSRIRKDLTWGTVMQDHYKNPQKNVLNGMTTKTRKQKTKKIVMVSGACIETFFTPEQSRDVGGTFAAKPHRHWTAKKGKNMRRFFEDFAKRHNFDPLAPENWYSISRMTILEEKVYSICIYYILFLYLIIYLKSTNLVIRPRILYCITSAEIMHEH